MCVSTGCVLAKILTPALPFIGLDMVKTSELLLPASRIPVLVAFTTSALHHSVSRDCACMCVSMFVDARCVQTSCMHEDFVHGYCCGFICVLSHVLECVHLHLGVGECA